MIKKMAGRHTSRGHLFWMPILQECRYENDGQDTNDNVKERNAREHFNEHPPDKRPADTADAECDRNQQVSSWKKRCWQQICHIGNAERI